MKKSDLQKLIHETVSNLYDVNEKNFDSSEQIMTPLSSEISVYAVIKILEQQGIFPKLED